MAHGSRVAKVMAQLEVGQRVIWGFFNNNPFDLLLQLRPAPFRVTALQEEIENPDAEQSKNGLQDTCSDNQVGDESQDACSEQPPKTPFFPSKECDGENNVCSAGNRHCRCNPSWRIRGVEFDPLTKQHEKQRCYRVGNYHQD